MASNCNPSAEEAETGDSPGFATQPAWPKIVTFQREILSQKKKNWITHEEQQTRLTLTTVHPTSMHTYAYEPLLAPLPHTHLYIHEKLYKTL